MELLCAANLRSLSHILAIACVQRVCGGDDHVSTVLTFCCRYSMSCAIIAQIRHQQTAYECKATILVIFHIMEMRFCLYLHPLQAVLVNL